MPGRSIFGTSFSMNHEFNFKGRKTEIRSKGKPCEPIKSGDNLKSADIAPFVPFVLGAVAVCSGEKKLSLLEQSVLGAVSAAGFVRVSQDPRTAQFVVEYLLAMLKLVNGASSHKGRITEEKLKQLIYTLMEQWLETAGPAFSSYKEALIDAMQKATLPDFMKGVQSTLCIMTGDPVNANTGNFVYEKEDLSIPGKYPLCFQRMYNVTDNRAGSMGIGWRHNYEIQLLILEDRYIVLWNDGREEIFLRGEDGKPEPLFGGQDCLRVEGDGYSYLTRDQKVYCFDRNGKLLKVKGANGQSLSFSYDKYGRLIQVLNSCDSRLLYHYDRFTGYLDQVTDHTGREVLLFYELGRLTEVKNAVGHSWRYSYDQEKRLYRIGGSKNSRILENVYDSEGRTIKQIFADNGEITYDYQEEQNRTLVTYQNGNRIAYVHDERFRNVKTIYYDGEENYGYNDRNQLIYRMDKNGNRTRFSYDDRGNITQVIHPDGSKYNMTYDSGNRLLVWSVNGAMRRKNIYDKEGNLLQTLDALGRSYEVEYDEQGNAQKIRQPDGSCWYIKYDTRGNVICITDDIGKNISYQYDACNRIVDIVDRNGNQTRFSYSNDNQLLNVCNAEGRCQKYEYTKDGKLSKMTDFNGAVICQEFNAMGKIKRLVLADGEIIQLEYDTMQNVSECIYANGDKIQYYYDCLNRLERVVLPTGGMERYEYDPNGNRTAIIDPQGGVTHLEYDVMNRVISITDQSGYRSEYEYNQEGQLTRVTDPMGGVYTYRYDMAGQLIEETDSLGNMVSYGYDEMGRISSVTDHLRNMTTYEYGINGELSKIVYPDSGYESYEYDANGNRILQKNQDGLCLEFDYDCLNRVTKIKNNLGGENNYAYDPVGNITMIQDSLKRVTKYEYSLGGKLISVTDALRNRTEYAYDQNGHLAIVCQHEGDEIILKGSQLPLNTEELSRNGKLHIIQYQKDIFGNIKSITDPMGRQEQYHYDMSGRVIMKRDKEGYETNYAYNPVGDIEQVSYAEGDKVIFEYDALQRLTEIVDCLGRTEIIRNKKGEVIQVKNPDGGKVKYQWDSLNNTEEILYPDGQKVCYQYDRYGRLGCLSDGMDKIIYSYNKQGLLEKKEYSNGVESRYQYDRAGMLCAMFHRKDGMLFEEYHYEYDLVGNRKKTIKKRNANAISDNIPLEVKRRIMDESGTYEYGYDSLNRLTEVVKDRNRVRSYKYDGFGNRIWMQEKEESTTYQYNLANQLISITGNGKERNYHYDRRGNVIEVKENGIIRNSYQYNGMNRLGTARDGLGREIVYTYNGLGMRVKESTRKDGEVLENVSYIMDPTQKYHNLLQIVKDGKRKDYIWDMNGVVMAGNEERLYYLLDEIGSPLCILDKKGQTENVYGYHEFGKVHYEWENEKQPISYTGYLRDSFSETCYAQSREYVPELGRFLGEDSYKGSTNHPVFFNYYSYCINNPFRYTDPEGKYTAWEGFLAHLEMEAIFLALYGDGNEILPYIRTSGINGIFSKDNFYGRINVPVPKTSQRGNMGYADMVLYEGGKVRVYEIKPDTYHDKNNPTLMQKGKDQLARYITGLSQGIPATAGMPKYIITGIELPYIGDSKKNIIYKMYEDAPGMIYYTITKKPKEEKQKKMEAILETTGVMGVILAILALLAELLKDVAPLLPLLASNNITCDYS